MFLARTHRLRIRLICSFILIYIFFISPFSSSLQAHAAVDPITVISQTDTVTFPKGIDFQMSAGDNAGNITQATIYIAFQLEQDQANFTESHGVTASIASQTATFHWHEDTNGTHFAPPGTRISYYWRINDNVGNMHIDQIRIFQIVDNRFSWQHLTDGMLQVNWYNRPGTFGQAILNQASSNVRRISGNLGGTLQRPVNLWIYETVDDFRGSLSPTTHEWVGGVALPSLDEASIVVQSTQDDTLSRDMPHELTHLIFHQLTIANIVPTWFDEGLAVYNQLYREPEMELRFKEALTSHSLLNLKSISVDFPVNSDQAYLAYAQSWKLVDYMYSTFTQQKMAQLIKTMSNPISDFDQDMSNTLGLDTAHLENQWHLYLNQPATLKPGQLQPAKSAQNRLLTMISTSDSNEPLLVLIGVLMILLSLTTSSGLLIYQRKARRQKPVHAVSFMLRTGSTYPAYPQYPIERQPSDPSTRF